MGKYAAFPHQQEQREEHPQSGGGKGEFRICGNVDRDPFRRQQFQLRASAAQYLQRIFDQRGDKERHRDHAAQRQRGEYE